MWIKAFYFVGKWAVVYHDLRCYAHAESQTYHADNRFVPFYFRINIGFDAQGIEPDVQPLPRQTFFRNNHWNFIPAFTLPIFVIRRDKNQRRAVDRFEADTGGQFVGFGGDGDIFIARQNSLDGLRRVAGVEFDCNAWVFNAKFGEYFIEETVACGD